MNSIKNEDGFLKGTNTDARGSKKSIIDAGCKISGKNVLIVAHGNSLRSIIMHMEHLTKNEIIERELKTLQLIEYKLNGNI